MSIAIMEAPSFEIAQPAAPVDLTNAPDLVGETFEPQNRLGAFVLANRSDGDKDGCGGRGGEGDDLGKSKQGKKQDDK